MAGRIPRPYWSDFYGQYVCTVDKKFRRLGKDKDKAEKRLKFLLRSLEREEEPTPNIFFGDLADLYLEHVQEHHTPERYRHCKERLQEFKDHIGAGLRAKDLRPKHVDSWIATKTLSQSSVRLYKSIILSCLNWAAKPCSKGGGGLIFENPLKGQLHLPAMESWGREAVWTPETFEQVLRVSSEAFGNLVRILAWTGARITTAVRIEARHYNQGQKRWDCGDLCRERGTKKVEHIRILSPEARELVEDLNEQYPEGPILRNSYGKPWDPDAPQIYMTNLKHKFKDTRGLIWQEGLAVSGLRHTFATHFLQQFPNEIEYLRVLLGHSTYKMIFQHYGHLIDRDAAAFKRMEGFSPF
jgi:integrase